MKTNSILFLALLFMTLGASAEAQQALQFDAPYHCNNGMSVTVIRCAPQTGKEYCEFKVEQNGKLAFQGVNLRERVMTGVKSCTTQASTPPAQGPGKSAPTGRPGAFNPAYLSEFPPADRVLEAMKVSDPRETALRQIWAFYELMEVVKVLSGPREFARTGMLPDEMKILTEYSVAQYNVTQAADKAFPSNKPGEDRAYHYSRWDARFGFKDVQIWQFFSDTLQSQFAQIVGADNARYAAKRAEEKRVAAEALQANSQGASGGGQSPFVRNDPGTLAARRCVELGGSALECVGKGFWSGLMDMAGVSPEAMKGAETSGVVMNGRYTNSSGLVLAFGQETFSITGCGKLVPNGHTYSVTKMPNQLLINVKNQPSSFVLSMGNDGKLSGPGATDVAGQIITGYRNVWMQEYRNGAAVAGGGYWTQEPIYAPKTERCMIGALAPEPALPPDKNPLTRDLTSAMDSLMPSGPTGLRMTGHYASPGGLALEFAVDSVVLDCGAAHVKQPYTVDNAPDKILVSVKNGASPFTLALQPNGTLLGSGSIDVTGRVVTGEGQNNGIAFAPRSARCSVSSLAAQ